MEYVIGIDAGGTKVSACIMDRAGKEQNRYTEGAMNINSEPPEVVRQRLTRLLQTICNEMAQDCCKAVCAGVAGCSNPHTKALWNEVVHRVYPHARFLLTGDHTIALEGALDNKNGLILIAGTGSICTGRVLGHEPVRVGGYGHLLDDGGSAYFIALKILQAVVRAEDGRGPNTLLSEMVFRQLGAASTADLVAFVYGESASKRRIAALAPLLDQAVARNDAAAQEIAQMAADELFCLVDTALQKMQLTEGVCSLMGGVLQKGTSVRRAFEKAMVLRYPAIRCILPIHDAAYGAAKMALRMQ